MIIETRSRHLVLPRLIYAFMTSILWLAAATGVGATAQTVAPEFARKAAVIKDALEGGGNGEAEDGAPSQSSKSPREVSPAPTRIVAYYFHGTIRCQTCLDIERMARETILESFFGDMMEGRLEWRAVNYEIPSNASLCAAFNLPHPSLALVSEASGITTSWKLLDRTWDLVYAPDEFRSYVNSEIDSLLATLFAPDPYAETMFSH